MTACDTCGTPHRYAWQAGFCCDPVVNECETVD